MRSSGSRRRRPRSASTTIRPIRKRSAFDRRPRQTSAWSSSKNFGRRDPLTAVRGPGTELFEPSGSKTLRLAWCRTRPVRSKVDRGPRCGQRGGRLPAPSRYNPGRYGPLISIPTWTPPARHAVAARAAPGWRGDRRRLCRGADRRRPGLRGPGSARRRPLRRQGLRRDRRARAERDRGLPGGDRRLHRRGRRHRPGAAGPVQRRHDSAEGQRHAARRGGRHAVPDPGHHASSRGAAAPWCSRRTPPTSG